MDKGFQLLWYICMGEVQLYLIPPTHLSSRAKLIS